MPLQRGKFLTDIQDCPAAADTDPMNSVSDPSRVAVLADAHGDLAALKAVLQDVAARGIERVWFLGDIIGSVGQGLECWDMLSTDARVDILLSGNHDYAVQEFTDDDLLERHFSPNKRGAIQAGRSSRLLLDDRYMHLPAKAITQLDGSSVHCVHASPGENLWEFLSSSKHAAWAFRDCPERLICFAHTHVRALACIDGSYKGAKQIRTGTQYPLDRGLRYALNPGALVESASWMELTESSVTWRAAPLAS